MSDSELWQRVTAWPRWTEAPGRAGDVEASLQENGARQGVCYARKGWPRQGGLILNMKWGGGGGASHELTTSERGSKGAMVSLSLWPL